MLLPCVQSSPCRLDMTSVRESLWPAGAHSRLATYRIADREATRYQPTFELRAMGEFARASVPLTAEKLTAVGLDSGIDSVGSICLAEGSGAAVSRIFHHATIKTASCTDLAFFPALLHFQPSHVPLLSSCSGAALLSPLSTCVLGPVPQFTFHPCC